MENTLYNYFKNNNWLLSDKNISVSKIFNFKNFTDAFLWMTEIAISSEINNHHPEWKNVYNRIDVTLTTHDEAKVTKKDYDLAMKMDMAFEKYN
tara:strand:- start:7 stop:288 length:282 start_codon:yes stop_codon:yes gene_type:complete